MITKDGHFVFNFRAKNPNEMLYQEYPYIANVAECGIQSFTHKGTIYDSLKLELDLLMLEDDVMETSKKKKLLLI